MGNLGFKVKGNIADRVGFRLLLAYECNKIERVRNEFEQEAMYHIEKYGSMHTDVIITSDYAHSQLFLQKVNSSVVVVNASTRFNDGNQLGLGSEIGISTTKLHAFGPMGLNELTTCKFVIYGNGQIREG